MSIDYSENRKMKVGGEKSKFATGKPMGGKSPKMKDTYNPSGDMKPIPGSIKGVTKE